MKSTLQYRMHFCELMSNKLYDNDNDNNKHLRHEGKKKKVD
jgi:hypothetical protein